MSPVAETRLVGDIGESSLAVVLEQHVARLHPGHEEIRVPVVVVVGEGGRDAQPVVESDTGCLGDVLEGAVTPVAPELVAAELGDQIEVAATVTIDIGNRDAVAVIVVSGLEGLGVVLGHQVAKRDATLGSAIAETEIVEDPEAGPGGELGGSPPFESLDPDVLRRDPHRLSFIGRLLSVEPRERRKPQPKAKRRPETRA